MIIYFAHAILAKMKVKSDDVCLIAINQYHIKFYSKFKNYIAKMLFYTKTNK